MPAVNLESPSKQTHRVVDILTTSGAVIGLCTRAPIVNFIAFNALEPRFSAGRAQQYALLGGDDWPRRRACSPAIPDPNAAAFQSDLPC